MSEADVSLQRPARAPRKPSGAGLAAALPPSAVGPFASHNLLTFHLASGYLPGKHTKRQKARSREGTQSLFLATVPTGVRQGSTVPWRCLAEFNAVPGLGQAAAPSPPRRGGECPADVRRLYFISWHGTIFS